MTHSFCYFVVIVSDVLAKEIEQDLIERVEVIKQKSGGRTPILATILVGEDPASATYVRMKGNACKRVGMESLKILLPQETTTQELLDEIDKLNANNSIFLVIFLQHIKPVQNKNNCF